MEDNVSTTGLGGQEAEPRRSRQRSPVPKRTWLPPQPPVCLLWPVSPNQAAGADRVCSLKTSQLGSRPGALDLADHEAPGVKGLWVTVSVTCASTMALAAASLGP